MSLPATPEPAKNTERDQIEQGAAAQPDLTALGDLTPPWLPRGAILLSQSRAIRAEDTSRINCGAVFPQRMRELLGEVQAGYRIHSPEEERVRPAAAKTRGICVKVGATIDQPQLSAIFWPSIDDAINSAATLAAFQHNPECSLSRKYSTSQFEPASFCSPDEKESREVKSAAVRSWRLVIDGRISGILRVAIWSELFDPLYARFQIHIEDGNKDFSLPFENFLFKMEKVVASGTIKARGEQSIVTLD